MKNFNSILKGIILASFLFFLSYNIYAQVSISTITNQFNGSGGLSLDSLGNLYIGDFGDFLSAGDLDGLPNNVWKMDKSGNLSMFSTGFIGASGNDFDNNGILYQSDIGANQIFKIVNGVRTFVTSTGISAPVGIVFDSQDNFFVCNCGNNTIRKVTPSGTSTLFASGTIFQCPNGITVDENDNLYVSNFSNGSIIKITSSGTTSLLNSTPGGSTSGPSNGHLDYHQATKSLYIASHGSNRIYKIHLDTPSVLKPVAGSGIRGNTNGSATTARFSRPNGVAITLTGDSIYINSAIPLTNTPNNPLNPQVIRLITGLQSGSVSVQTLNKDKIEIKTYPNPVSENLFIESKILKPFKNATVEIYDFSGKLILLEKKEKTLQNQLKIDVSYLKEGHYSYSISNNNQQLFTGFFIKK